MTREYLISRAYDAMKNTYSPHSHYPVGAALQVKGGKVYLGTNVENDSFGLTMCAERSAIFSAISNGEKGEDFESLVVVTRDGGTSCGACRQVMIQFNPNMSVRFCNLSAGDEAELNLKAESLLPIPFKL